MKRKPDDIIANLLILIFCSMLLAGVGWIMLNRQRNPYDCEINFPMRGGDFHQCVQAREAIKNARFKNLPQIKRI